LEKLSGLVAGLEKASTAGEMFGSVVNNFLGDGFTGDASTVLGDLVLSSEANNGS